MQTTTTLLYSIIDRIGKQKFGANLLLILIMANCEKQIEAADEVALGSFCEGVIEFHNTNTVARF
jgi:hypothetical protein